MREVADIRYYLDEAKIADEAAYDGLYAVCTDLIDDDVKDILKVSEGRWQIEECFRIMKTDFSARPVYIRRDDRIEAHFLICFLGLLIYCWRLHELRVIVWVSVIYAASFCTPRSPARSWCSPVETVPR